MNTIKLTANELLNANRSFMTLVEQSLPPKGSYTLHRILSKIQPEVQLLDKKRNELIQKLGTKQEDGNFSILQKNEDGTDNPSYKKFVEEYTAILETEIEVQSPKLNLDHLGDLHLSVTQLAPMAPFLMEIE